MEVFLYFLFSLLITAVGYTIVPLIISIVRDKKRHIFSLKTIRTIIIINGICVWIIFQIIRIQLDISGTSGAVFLWSAVAYWIMKESQPIGQYPPSSKLKTKKQEYVRLFTNSPADTIEENTQNFDRNAISEYAAKMAEDDEFLSMVEMLSKVDVKKREAVKSVLKAFYIDDER